MARTMVTDLIDQELKKLGVHSVPNLKSHYRYTNCITGKRACIWWSDNNNCEIIIDYACYLIDETNDDAIANAKTYYVDPSNPNFSVEKLAKEVKNWLQIPI